MSNINSTKAGYHVFVDTAGSYPANPGGTHYWVFSLDYFADMYWLHFAKRKSEMVKFVSNLLRIFKVKGISIEYLNCENSGERMSRLRTLFYNEGI